MAAPIRSTGRSRSRRGALNPLARPDLHNTHPVVPIGPHPQWSDPDRIVSLDPWGHLVGEVFGGAIATGTDIRPTIAITKARLNLPEILAAMAAHRLAPDGGILHANGDVSVTKIAIDPVWWLPGHRAALRRDASATCAARCSSRRAACSPNSSPGPTSRCSCRRSAARRSTVIGEVDGAVRPDEDASPAGCTTSATARTCSGPTSAPAGPTSSTASRNA